MGDKNVAREKTQFKTHEAVDIEMVDVMELIRF